TSLVISSTCSFFRWTTYSLRFLRGRWQWGQHAPSCALPVPEHPERRSRRSTYRTPYFSDGSSRCVSAVLRVTPHRTTRIGPSPLSLLLL
ncbi:hypothetical protein PENTCL1PPCAC_27932, partial [Pristionchus entomophagus]